MSDYLERQASRALGRAPAIRPRLVSLYEPVEMAAEDDPYQPTTGPAESERAGVERSPAPAVRQVHSAPDGSLPKQTSGPPEMSVGSESREPAQPMPEVGKQCKPIHTEGAISVPRVSNVDTEETLSGRPNPTNVRSRVSPPQKGPALFPRIRGGSGGDHDDDETGSAFSMESFEFGPTSAKNPIAVLGPKKSNADSAESILIEQNVGPVGTNQNVTGKLPAEETSVPRETRIVPAPVRTRPHSIDHAREAPLESDRPDETERPPSINITIGRVEIRAVTPNVPPAAAAIPLKPRISLEEYLKSGGSR